MLRHLFISALFLLLVGCSPKDSKSQIELSKCYEAEFGTLPPKGITVLKARSNADYYTGEQWLQIVVESNLLDSVILKNFTNQTFAPKGIDATKNIHIPDWWIHPPFDGFEFYTCGQWTRGSWNASFAAIAVNRTNGMVYFHSMRLD